MHFQEFFQVALQTNSKIHRTRQALLRIGFSVYALYRQLHSCGQSVAPNVHSVLALLQQHKLLVEGDPRDLVERLFGIAPGATIQLADMVRFLNADEKFQVSVYGDRPLTKRIVRKTLKLIHVELLLMKLVDNYRNYLKHLPKGLEKVVQAFHQIDVQRHYFVNPTNLMRYMASTTNEEEVARLLDKLWRVRGVPFLDFYQFFVGGNNKDSRSISKQRQKPRRPTSERKPNQKTIRSRSSRSRGLSSTPTVQHTLIK